MAQESAAERDAEAEDVLDAVLLAQVGDDVAHGGEADAVDRGGRGVVGEVVDAAGDRGSGELDGLGVDPAPGGGWELLRGVGFGAAHGEPGCLHVGGGIGECDVLHGFGSAGAEHDLVADALHDRGAGVGGDGDADAHAAIGDGRLRLPARPDHRVAAAEGERVSGVVGAAGIVQQAGGGLFRVVQP